MNRRPLPRPLEPGLAAVASALLFFAVARARPFHLGDEGYLFLVARELAAGGEIHARFDPIYPGGVFAWFGSWMRALGAVVPVFRAAAAVLVGLAAGGLWWLLRARVGPALTAAALAAIVALGTVAGAFKLVGMVAVAAALDRLLAARRAPATAAAAPAWIALPAATGLLAGWREDSAALLLALSAWAWWRGPRTAGRAAAWIGAAVGGALPWLLFFGARGELAAMTEHVLARFAFLFRRLADPTEVAWRPPASVPVSFEQLGHALLPALVVLPTLLYAFLLVRGWRRRAVESADADLLAALLGFAYLAQFAWERPDVTHFRFHSPVLIVAIALSVAGAAGRRRALVTAALLAPIVAVAAQRLAAPADELRRYPCCAGAAAEIRLRAIPEWAGRLDREGGTAIVLGWLPGLYLLEGERPGTRFLSTFARHLDDHEVRELGSDLLAPSNRWVFETGGPVPAGIRELLASHYERVPSRSGLRLWRRAPTRTPLSVIDPATPPPR